MKIMKKRAGIIPGSDSVMMNGELGKWWHCVFSAALPGTQTPALPPP